MATQRAACQAGDSGWPLFPYPQEAGEWGGTFGAAEGPSFVWVALCYQEAGELKDGQGRGELGLRDSGGCGVSLTSPGDEHSSPPAIRWL